MTKEELIRMAREAGIPIETDWAGRPATLVIKDGGTYLRGIEDLERFATLVAAAEREACAMVALAEDDRGSVHQRLMQRRIAAAIRARERQRERDRMPPAPF